MNTTSTASSSSVPSVTTKEAFAAHLSSGNEFIGDMMCWVLSDAEFNFGKLEQLWKDAGLPTDLLPKPQTPEKALHLAVRKAQSGENRRLIRKIEDSTNTLSFGLVSEVADGAAQRLDYTQNNAVVLNKVTGQLLLQDRNSELALEIESNFNHYSNMHPTKDLMSAIVKLIRTFHAVALRESGGFYWIPAVHAPQLRALKGIVEQFGGSKVSLYPVHNTLETVTELRGVAANTLDAELQKLTEEINKFATEGFNSGSLERRLVAFDELRMQAEMYSTVLGLTSDGIMASMETLRTQVNELLKTKAVEKAAKGK